MTDEIVEKYQDEMSDTMHEYRKRLAELWEEHYTLVQDAGNRHLQKINQFHENFEKEHPGWWQACKDETFPLEKNRE